MRMVEVKVTPVRDGEEVFYTVRVDSKDATGNVKAGDEAEYSTKEDAEPKKMLIEDNQSLVVSGTASTEQYYDSAQMATLSRKKEIKKPKEGEEEDGVEGGGPKEAKPKSGTYSGSQAPGSQTQGQASYPGQAPGGAKDSHQAKGEKPK